jgi:hypothetical protein
MSHRRIHGWAIALLVWSAGGGLSAQPTRAAGADTLDPLLAHLAGWADVNPKDSYPYTVVASGAALAIGYRPDSGFHVPASLRLLWPGNVCLLADSAYVSMSPHSLTSAQEMLLSALRSASGALLVTPEPVYVYGADSSFGDPWFFVVSGDASRSDTALWDSGDLKRKWWLWSDDPGANTIWPRPGKARAARGREAVLAGLRNCVLAARPKTSEVSTGLAAFDVAVTRPGARDELQRLAVIRRAAASYLSTEQELWPPAEREPIRLAVYYLEKSAQAWRDLAERSPDWELTSAERREELLTAVRTHETSAALALDAFFSPARQ